MMLLTVYSLFFFPIYLGYPLEWCLSDDVVLVHVSQV